VTSLTSKEKRKVFEGLLEQGVTALHLDPRREGVDVPPWLRDQPWLVLNYSYRYGIADLRWDDDAVCASLSFARQPYPCRVPWSAVFGITDDPRHQGRTWERDVPPDLHAPRPVAPRPAAVEAPSTAPQPTHARARISLQVIAGGGAHAEDREGGDEPPPSPPAARPALRRIK
jgi:stringent starvation protein B